MVKNFWLCRWICGRWILGFEFGGVDLVVMGEVGVRVGIEGVFVFLGYGGGLG